MNSWKRFIDWCQRPGMIKIQRGNLGIGVAELSRGAKAGAVSGGVSGVVHSPIQNFGGMIVWTIIGRLRNLPVQSFESWVAGFMQPWFLASIIGQIIIGVVAGLIFGLMFAALYDKLPGKTPKMKGIVMSIIYWLALPVGIPMLYYIGDWGLEGLHAFFMGPYAWVNPALSLIPSILWGWLLGHFWASERLGKL